MVVRKKKESFIFVNACVEKIVSSRAVAVFIRITGVRVAEKADMVRS